MTTLRFIYGEANRRSNLGYIPLTFDGTVSFRFWDNNPNHGDCKRVYDWRNSRHVQDMSRNREEISYKTTHKPWYKNQLRNDERGSIVVVVSDDNILENTAERIILPLFHIRADLKPSSHDYAGYYEIAIQAAPVCARGANAKQTGISEKYREAAKALLGTDHLGQLPLMVEMYQSNAFIPVTESLGFEEVKRREDKNFAISGDIVTFTRKPVSP